MKTINLRDYYPEIYKQDEYTQVPDEVLETLLATKRTNTNYLRRLYYNKAFYSLDQSDGIETAALHKAPNPADVFEQEERERELWIAMRELTPTQKRRVYKYFFEKKNMAAIGREEGVGTSSVKESIASALRKMEVFLKIGK